MATAKAKKQKNESVSIKEETKPSVQLSSEVQTQKQDGRMNTAANFVRADGKAENGPLTIIKAKELKEAGTTGIIVEGTYLRKSISETYGTPSYIFSTANGDVLVNGCGSLNKQMENVKEGDLVQVEYRGSAAIKDGKFKGKESHLFTVFRAVDSNDDSEA